MANYYILPQAGRTFGFRSTMKHFRGEGGCCGSGTLREAIEHAGYTVTEIH